MLILVFHLEVMITFIIIIVLLIQSCNTGSSTSSKCKKQQGPFARFWSLLEIILDFICTANGIWTSTGTQLTIGS
ncbi:unnamed protein product [Schistosoma rodhaini]|uniref:Uncharacterized protein n=1 Tax=Schistosoma rodhaini TaxID=6188 RepID=A0AA85G752_9TREM|nr:unnamed protein product [Schistosoma rodhaini]